MRYMPPIKSDVHITPDIIWELIKENWGWDKEEFFDPCPVDYKLNGLLIKWKEMNFVNPPYSRQKGEKKSLLTLFVDKALKEKGTTVMLLPSKTDQEWFHKIKEFDMIWIRGRLKFVGNKWSATQPHFLVKIN
jgi:hypothetical protein